MAKTVVRMRDSGIPNWTTNTFQCLLYLRSPLLNESYNLKSLSW